MKACIIDTTLSFFVVPVCNALKQTTHIKDSKAIN